MPTSRRTVLLAAIASVLPGCGFHPVVPLSVPFEKLYVAPSDYSSFAAEFKRYVESYSRTSLAPDRASARAILVVKRESQQTQILSLSGAGRVAEYLLRYQVVFSLQDKSGKDIIAPTEINLQRDFAYSDVETLGKENEQAYLFQDMRQDAIQQVIRRLAAVKLDEPAAAS